MNIDEINKLAAQGAVIPNISPDVNECSNAKDDIDPSLQKRLQEKEYTEILILFKNNYQQKTKDNHCYKSILFSSIMATLGLILISFVALCIVLLFHPELWRVVVPIIGGSGATMVVALLKLPEIIAKHLFPLDEDKHMVELIKAIKGKKPNE